MGARTEGKQGRCRPLPGAVSFPSSAQRDTRIFYRYQSLKLCGRDVPKRRMRPLFVVAKQPCPGELPNLPQAAEDIRV